MTEFEMKETFRVILEMLKQQALYSHRLHGWVIAVADAIREKPELKSVLEQHPFYDQGSEWRIQNIDVLTRNIDVLLAQFQR